MSSKIGLLPKFTSPLLFTLFLFCSQDHKSIWYIVKITIKALIIASQLIFKGQEENSNKHRFYMPTCPLVESPLRYAGLCLPERGNRNGHSACVRAVMFQLLCEEDTNTNSYWHAKHKIDKFLVFNVGDSYKNWQLK